MLMMDVDEEFKIAKIIYNFVFQNLVSLSSQIGQATFFQVSNAMGIKVVTMIIEAVRGQQKAVKVVTE